MRTIYVYLAPDGYVDGWSDTYAPNTMEITLPYDHSFFIENEIFKCFKHVDGDLIKDTERIFKHQKLQKMKQIESACTETILNGFEFHQHTFDFTENDQLLILYKKLYLDTVSTPPTTISWKDSKGEIVNLTPQEFNEFFITSEEHRQFNLERCKNLQKKIEDAITPDELSAINW